MPKYLKKGTREDIYPLVVEAKQYEFGMEDGWELYGACYPKTGPVPRHLDRKPAIKILEGWHVVCPGDWIITTKFGDKQLIDPNFFHENYEKVDYICGNCSAAYQYFIDVCPSCEVGSLDKIDVLYEPQKSSDDK